MILFLICINIYVNKGLLFRKTKECSQLRANLQQSLNSVDESISDVSLSTAGESVSSLPTSSSEVSNLTAWSNLEL